MMRVVVGSFLTTVILLVIEGSRAVLDTRGAAPDGLSILLLVSTAVFLLSLMYVSIHVDNGDNQR